MIGEKKRPSPTTVPDLLGVLFGMGEEQKKKPITNKGRYEK